MWLLNWLRTPNDNDRWWTVISGDICPRMIQLQFGWTVARFWLLNVSLQEWHCAQFQGLVSDNQTHPCLPHCPSCCWIFSSLQRKLSFSLTNTLLTKESWSFFNMSLLMFPYLRARPIRPAYRGMRATGKTGPIVLLLVSVPCLCSVDFSGWKHPRLCGLWRKAINLNPTCRATLIFILLLFFDAANYCILFVSIIYLDIIMSKVYMLFPKII